VLKTENNPGLVRGSNKNLFNKNEERIMKLKILNKKGYDKDNIKYAQVMVKGSPKSAGEIVDLDAKNDIADINELVYNGWAEPADGEAKKLFTKWKSPFTHTEAAVETFMDKKK